MGDVVGVRVRIGRDGPVRHFKGRFAWALLELIRAGKQGVTTLERPAPRWSHYVFRLRRDGLAIETREERHPGPYPGRHGRYVLVSEVDVIDVKYRHEVAA